MLRNTRAVALVATALVVLSAVTAPAAAQSAPEPDVVTYATGGETVPSVIVEYDADSLSSLQAWANESATRSVVSVNERDNRAVVAAPAWATRSLPTLDQLQATIASGFDALTTDPLATEAWVKDVAVNYRIQLDRPSILDASQFSAPQVGLFGFDDPSLPTDGLAFTDQVNASPMSDARDAVGADNLSATGDGVTVAVLDTGANTANGRVFGNGTAGSDLRISNASKNMLTGAAVDAPDGNYSAISDGNGHGTWISSSIAANVSDATYDGVAPDAELLVLKTLGDDGSGSTAAIADGIRYAADQGADVISMSLGSPVYSEALADAVAYAEDNGSVVVLAAGNSRPQRGAAIASPADVEGALTVGATTAEPPQQARSAYFSQVGPDPGTTDLSAGAAEGAGIDAAAPGFKLTAKVASTSGSVSNSTLSGTSMATPLVSGVIAAAQADNSTIGTLEPAAVDSAVRSSARPAPNLAVAETGAGIVAADNLADGTTPETDQPAAMDDAAAQRDAFYEALSDAAGGLLVGLLT